MDNEDSDDYGIEAKRTFKPKGSVSYIDYHLLFSPLSPIKLKLRRNQKSSLNQLLL